VVERSPSSVLLLPHAEHSAAQAGALAHPDGYPDARRPAVAALAPRPTDADQWTPSASDASDGAPRGAAEAGAHQPPHLADEGAGRSVVLELDVLAPGGLQLDAHSQPKLAVQAQTDAVAELCKPDADRSAAQSFAVRAAVAERSDSEEQLDAELPPAEPQMQPAMVRPEPAAQLRPRVVVVVWPDAAVPQPAARAQHKQASPLVWGSQSEQRAQAAPVQPQALALEQLLEQVQRALLPQRAEPRQVSPQLAALPGGVAAEPRPLPSSA
jgi:hypothetical protein